MFDDNCNLTKSVVAGLKTQTRKVTDKLQFHTDATSLGFSRFDYSYANKGVIRVWNDKEHTFLVIRSRYKLGETVAVAQCYNDVLSEFPYLNSRSWFDPKENCAGMTNKMFVRADLMPHRIEITGIKVERLQDISDKDILREGIVFNKFYVYHILMSRFGFKCRGTQFWFDSGKAAYASLINMICGKYTWKQNPWVFVYDFKLTQKLY